ELALGFFAAWHTAAEVSFGAGPYGFGIGLAEIAALAAIELGHRRHQLALRLAILGGCQALGHRERAVVPREVFIRLRRRGILGCGDFTADAEIGGEEAVQPGALLARERRVLGDQRGDGRYGVHAASADTGAASASSCSSAI